MGANFETHEAGNCNEQTLRDNFRKLQDDLCYQHGRDGYAGHLGITTGLTIHDKKFDSYTEAEEWLMDNANKGEDAVAVQYASKVDKITKAGQIIIDRYKRLDKEFSGFDKAILQNIKRAKSRTIGCKNCGSSISRKHLSSVNCPVCQNTQAFVSNTDKKRKDRLRERRAEAFTQTRNTSHTKTSGYVWLIGGTCAC